MRVRIIGGGWYGCHLALKLMAVCEEVELHEIGERLFDGASGANPARLHRGFHYPRSRLTRAACLEHAEAFERAYGHLTRPVPINLYAVAAEDSLVDFGSFRQVLAGETEFVTVNPAEFGLVGCEGAVLTGERHIVIDEAREWFTRELGGRVRFGQPAGDINDPAWDWTIDCTFCALDGAAVDRYEPCVTVLLEGPTDRAVTIMDGPFPSIYPWKEAEGLSSLTSARFTPLSKACRTWDEARHVLAVASPECLGSRMADMFDQICGFWPAAADLYKIVDYRTGIRAMPKSGADARLVDVVSVGPRALRVRAGKIDAIFRAEALIREELGV